MEIVNRHDSSPDIQNVIVTASIPSSHGIRQKVRSQSRGTCHQSMFARWNLFNWLIVGRFFRCLGCSFPLKIWWRWWRLTCACIVLLDNHRRPLPEVCGISDQILDALNIWSWWLFDLQKPRVAIRLSLKSVLFFRVGWDDRNDDYDLPCNWHKPQVSLRWTSALAWCRPCLGCHLLFHEASHMVAKWRPRQCSTEMTPSHPKSFPSASRIVLLYSSEWLDSGW